MVTLHSIATNFDPQQTTIFSIPSQTQIDVEGFLAWVHMKQDVQNIRTLEIADDVLSNLTSLIIGNDGCHWNDVVQIVHRMTRLENIEFPRGASSQSQEVFPVMLEDLLKLMAPSMHNFKRFSVTRQVVFGYMPQERLQLLVLNFPPAVEEFLVSDVSFRIQAMHPQLGTEIPDKIGVILSKLTHLKRLSIGQPSCWSPVFSTLSASNLQMIFRYPSLQHVTLRNMSLSDDHLEIIAEELMHNCTLETIDLGGSSLLRSTRGYDSVLRVMEHQFYVKRIKLFTPDCLYMEDDEFIMLAQQLKFIAMRVDSFARLNQADRRHVLRDEMSTREDLFKMVEMVRHDPNATFTILRSHPQIIGAL